MNITYEKSIIDVVLGHAEATPDRLAVVFDQGGGPVSQLTYRQLAAAVAGRAGGLVERGLGGRQVALLFTAGTEFVVALLACLAAGSVAIPLAPVGRRKTRLQNLLNMLNTQKPDGLMVDEAMAALFGRELAAALAGEPIDYLEYDGLEYDGLEYDGLECDRLEAAVGSFAPEFCPPEKLAVLQYTSGTTSRPKGVMITHGNIIANQVMIRESFGHDQRSNFVGWVPHYHDQGLFGNILQPLFLGSTCVLTSPAAFINRPLTWLKLISDYRAHTSGGPNFGFDLCARSAMRLGVPPIDLRSWRVAFNGAERILPATLDRFAECFAGVGFDRRAFLPCYGLAESTLVTVVAARWRPPVVRRYQSTALADGAAVETASRSGSIDLVCCGPAMPGSEAVIVAEGGREQLPDGRVGEIWLRGPHVSPGYFRDQAATEETFGAFLDTGEGPFLRTGDLGFSAAEGLYVVGRIKDVINLQGRKFAPSDVEHIWSRISSQTGQERFAAVQVEIGDSQHVVLVSEMKRADTRNLSADGLQKLASMLRSEAIEILDLGVTDLVIVPEGQIPRTTSGKVQRKKTIELVLAGQIPVLAMTGPLERVLADLECEPS